MSLVRSTQLAILLLFIVSAFRLLGPQKFLNALLASVLLYTLVFSVAALTLPAASLGRVLHGHVTRFTWFGTHPLIVATFAATSGIIVLAQILFAQEALRRRILGVPIWIILPPLIVILVATRARGQLIAFVAVVAYLLVRRFGRLWMFAVGIPVVAGLLTIYLNSDIEVGELLERHRGGNAVVEYIYRRQSVEQLTSLSGRKELWEIVGGLVSSRPIAGYGFAASRKVLLDKIPWASYAHNALAQVLLNLGIFGALLLFGVLGSCFVTGSGHPQHNRNPSAPYLSGVLGVALFLALVSLIHESFAGVPGYEIALLMICSLAAERFRRSPEPLSVSRRSAPDLELEPSEWALTA